MQNYSEEDDDYFDPDELCEEFQEGLRSGTIKTSADIPQEQSPPPNTNVTVGGRKCKCGSTTHVHISNKSCPLNKKNKSSG